MTANAYSLPTDDLWFDLANDQWYQNSSFGWDSDGLRGYVYGDDKNSTIVITIKGTSARFFLGGDSETSARDKLNDNRLFSCCCARIDYSWSTVCDCYMSSGKCNQQCLEDSLQSDDLYFQAAANLFLYVSDQYPQADIWLTGHSLGGSLAGLLGLTYGQPTVGFQAPGDRLAASRLHLPVGPGADMRKMPIFHFGHNADPLFVGSCNGGGSSCYYGGYAMESKCHIGSSCIFDTVREKGWRVNIGNHRIHKVLDEVLGDESIPWPACEVDEECTDCSDWSFE
ncbi:Alpha/Beta hydrolase protein [Dimargaris cristalligena]|uniref:triacylglycerol lipase n=1 Tax=Dimargaris cristalligena TaxID=215637 RepID=A0A4P9ZP82_9FUNG|nr:Alpha/Beta hydrolase protein [Dimargaris cristalligena]|eukprot:RKP35025.1 Alpha/Beta hydrolase protein [Dimargaris cristalligena]